MARVLFGPLVTAVKGSIGGVTFQGNPSGSIIRSRPHLSKSSTIKQSEAHSLLQVLNYEWQQIGQRARDDWNDYAATWDKVNKFGQSKTLTGLNWFTSVNYWRIALSLSLFSTPPPHNIPPDAPAFEILTDASALQLVIDGVHDYSLYPVIIWASIPTRVNTLSINQVKKILGIITATPASPYNITSLWEAATGLTWNPVDDFPSANIFVCLQTFPLSSGITSPLLCTKSNVGSESSDYFYYYG